MENKWVIYLSRWVVRLLPWPGTRERGSCPVSQIVPWIPWISLFFGAILNCTTVANYYYYLNF